MSFKLKKFIQNEILNKKDKNKLIFLNIVNKANWCYIVHAQYGDDELNINKEIGWRRVEPDEVYSIYSTRNKLLKKNDCLFASVESNCKIARFPLYSNDGTIRNNLFEIRNDGIYLNDCLFSTFKLK